jgi:hypothetical protein
VVPGATQTESSTGVGDEVTSTMMSASRTAASAEPAAVIAAGTWPLISATNRSRLAVVGSTRVRIGCTAAGLRVAACLHAGAEDRERRGVGPRHVPRRHGRHSRRPRFGDVAAVHERDERAGVRVEQEDGRQMRRQAAPVVLAEDRHDLRAELRRIGYIGRHQAVVGLRGPHRQDTHRLQHLTGRERASAVSIDAMRSASGRSAVTWLGEEAETLRHAASSHNSRAAGPGHRVRCQPRGSY